VHKIAWRPDIPFEHVLENKRLRKILLARYFPNEDGNETEILVYDADIEFFNGLGVAGFKEAADIAEALSKHSVVRLTRDTSVDD
jgi:hypothetical protein